MKRILVGLGEEAPAGAATQHAIELAQRFDASITAIGIVDLVRLGYVGPVPVGGGASARQLRQERYQKASAIISRCVESFRKSCESASVRFSVRRDAGDAMPTLIEVARYHDLLICGLGGMFEHGVVDEPPEELRQIIEAGVRPVLAVTHEYREVKRVLIAYSGSVESATTLRYFAMMNPYPKAQVRIVHFDGDGGQAMLDDAQSYLATHGIEADCELRTEKPKDGLLPYASGWQADLIVVGNSAKSLIRRRIFGETALEAMRSSRVPLFLGQ